ncbi:hypothetical protein E1B28_006630 [Marasmius oreades]|uniref:Uncharacterized protein n=1 Tax=Marasmius oreades TaxID=181124 RepID=A0A9P7UWI2_9AGAR|nr:uncharacterized protein E1B28_006630 [Marasmius oreades]KAG7095946.1 hypothetical protein E1B28_006630 [Marasmius oreades]
MVYGQELKVNMGASEGPLAGRLKIRRKGKKFAQLRPSSCCSREPSTIRIPALSLSISFFLTFVERNSAESGGGLYPPGLLPLIDRANTLLSTGQSNEAANVHSEAIGPSLQTGYCIPVSFEALALDDLDIVLKKTSKHLRAIPPPLVFPINPLPFEGNPESGILRHQCNIICTSARFPPGLIPCRMV